MGHDESGLHATAASPKSLVARPRHRVHFFANGQHIRYPIFLKKI